MGDAARFCASRDRQSTGNSRSKPHGPKARVSCVVVQNVPLGALISLMPTAPAGRRKCHPYLTEPPPHKAPDRRGGGARRVGSARARAARGWGQGAGAAWRCLGEHVRHAGRDSFMIKDAKSGIPNLVSEVSGALCSARKSLARSSVYTSFQQFV